MTVSPNQGADGKFLPANNANPEGKNGHLEGWQRSSIRLQYWYEKPVEEVMTLFENNGALLRKLSGYDAACARIVFNSYGGKKSLENFREAIDRIEGKVRQTVALEGGDPSKPVKLGFTIDFHSPMASDAPDVSPPEALPKTD